MDSVWLLLWVGVMSRVTTSSAIEWNSVQEYLEAFQYENTGMVKDNASVEVMPNNGHNNNMESMFKTPPLLSMFPGSPPHVYFNSAEVGDPLILTPFIENGELEEARNLSMVKCGYSDIVSYTGFFTVNKKYNSNLFFWYIPAQVELKG